MKWVCVGVALVAALLIVAGCGVDSRGGAGGSGGGAGGGSGGGAGGGGGGVDPGNAAIAEQEVFKKVNEEREKAGVSALNWSEALANLARAHSHCMCERDFFDHINLDGMGPTERGSAGKCCNACGDKHSFTPCCPSPFASVGENIAYGQGSPEDAMDAWMSSDHKANILNANYTHIGVGLCTSSVGNCDGSGNCGKHWTQNFGTAH